MRHIIYLQYFQKSKESHTPRLWWGFFWARVVFFSCSQQTYVHSMIHLSSFPTYQLVTGPQSFSPFNFSINTLFPWFYSTTQHVHFWIKARAGVETLCVHQNAECVFVWRAWLEGSGRNHLLMQPHECSQGERMGRHCLLSRSVQGMFLSLLFPISHTREALDCLGVDILSYCPLQLQVI